MKLTEAMKVIDDGWIRRCKGFRVRFQRKEGDTWVTDEFPDPPAKPLTSEISAWELARRFAAAACHGPGIDQMDRVNIHVVDDLGTPILFYGTNHPRILNQKKVDADNAAGGTPA